MNQPSGIRTTIFSLFLSIAAAAATGSPARPFTPQTAPMLDSKALSLDATATGAIRSFGRFGRMVVQDAGRRKPLDTYARGLLLQCSGKSKLKGESALSWFAKALFAPERSMDDKIFLINNSSVAEALGIAPDRKRRYSYAQLYPGIGALDTLSRAAMQSDPKTFTPMNAELVRLARAVGEYVALTSTFSFAKTMPGFDVPDSSVRALLQLPDQPAATSYLMLLSRSPLVADAMRSLQDKPQDQWSAADSAIISVAMSMYRWSSMLPSGGPAIIPSPGNDTGWMSPTYAIKTRAGAAARSPEMQSLVGMANAYRRGSQDDFDRTVLQFNAVVAAQSKSGDLAGKIDAEIFLNNLNPFFLAKILYAVALLVLLLSFLTAKKWPLTASMALVIAATVLHAAGIALRVFITGHPPLSNLYETFVAVSWLCAVLGLALTVVQDKLLGLSIASLMGVVFLHIAGRFGLDGDTMGVLSAVLNSNFWLATHVSTIAAGYAGCCAAGIIAHVYLVRRALNRLDAPSAASLDKSIYGVLAFGLVFTCIGTVLGGLWADQAWGRFWGWDPKENGALLIVLWCAAVLHARLSGFIRATGAAVAAIIGTVLVMFAWLGVNLLGVGLHSYGFTSTGAYFLFGFVGFEVLFLAVTGIVMRLRRTRT